MSTPVQISRARDALLAIPPDLPRDQWHEVGRAAIAAGLSVDDLDEWSAPAANYKGRRDIESSFRTVKSEGGTGAGTLFHYAQQYGFNDASPGPTTNKPEKTRQKRSAQAASPNAADVWGRCILADAADGYIFRKKGKPDGLRVYPASASPLVICGQNVAGYLAVPCWSGDKLQTLQLIPPASGDKLNLPGASFNDGFFTVGAITDRVYICEGIGQAWACNKATGAAAVVCFGAGRMMTVAKVVRDKFPAAALVVVPDKGKENQAAEIAAAVAGQWVEMPDDKTANYDANDYAAEHGYSALLGLLECTKGPQLRYRLLSGADLCNVPPMRWMVRGVLPADGIAALYGASGSGKSFLALDMCAAVAGSGPEWFACRVKAVPVVYVALEGEAGFSQRVKAWQLHHGRDLPDAMCFVMQPLDLRKADDVSEIARAVTNAGAAGGLLVIDTLNRAASGADENSSSDMGEIINAAKGVQDKLGGLVLLVHHSGKDATKGLRGHSSLHAALDAAIEVTRSDDRREWRVAKAKDGDDGKSHPFKLKVVEIGEHDDGDPMTSCVVVADKDAPADFRRTLPPKSGNQKVVWDALSELLRKAGDARPNDAPASLPKGRPAVTVEAAIAGLRGRLACDDKRKTERTQQALTGLQAKGLVAIDGGYIWEK